MKLFTAMMAAAVMCVLAGCASKQVPPEIELRAEPDFNVQYNGEVGDTGSVPTDLPEFTTAGEDETLAFILEVRFLRLPLERANEVFGENATNIGAFSMAEDPFELKLLSKIDILSAPRVTVSAGQTGTIMILDEVAYISGFELEGKDGARVADPVVSTVTDGMILGLRAVAAGDDRMQLWADLTVAELERPIATQEVLVFGSPMTVQTPVVFTQRLKAEGEIGEDRVLALTGMVGQSKDEVVVVMIKSERMTLEDTEYQPEEPADKDVPGTEGE